MAGAVAAAQAASCSSRRVRHPADGLPAASRPCTHAPPPLAAGRPASPAQAEAAQAEVDAVREQLDEVKAALQQRAEAQAAAAAAAARDEAEAAAAQQRSALQAQLAAAQAGAAEQQQAAAAAAAAAEREREERGRLAAAVEGERALLAQQQEAAAAAQQRFELLKKNYEVGGCAGWVVGWNGAGLGGASHTPPPTVALAPGPPLPATATHPSAGADAAVRAGRGRRRVPGARGVAQGHGWVGGWVAQRDRRTLSRSCGCGPRAGWGRRCGVDRCWHALSPAAVPANRRVPRLPPSSRTHAAELTELEMQDSAGDTIRAAPARSVAA